MKHLALCLLLAVASASPAFAVQPDEILADPGMETRARMISQEIRCPVCQGENIDDSNAPISRDLRMVIRERLVAGDSNDEVIDFVVARYGEFVLFNPRTTGWNWVLWLAGPAMLVLACLLALPAVRRRKTPVVDALSADEEARLRDILKD